MFLTAHGSPLHRFEFQPITTNLSQNDNCFLCFEDYGFSFLNSISGIIQELCSINLEEI